MQVARSVYWVPAPPEGCCRSAERSEANAKGLARSGNYRRYSLPGRPEGEREGAGSAWPRSAVAEQTSVFLSYRRADTPHVSGRLGDRLAERYKLFMDIDNIRPGMDFTKVVRDAINECDVLLALIGPNWLTSFDGVAKRNPDNPRDWVVEEVRAALQRDIAVIPVLVDGARMPDPAEVPPVLEPLTYRQALTLRHESFSADVAKLSGRSTR